MTMRSTLIYAGTIILGLSWMGAVSFGLKTVWAHENTPGLAAHAEPHWPADATLHRIPQRPTLVLFAHPQCPCTRATIAELAVLMTRTHGKLDATVAFIKPPGMPADWEKTDVWAAAAEIPGVTVLADPAGLEAQRFGSETSGQTMLYDPAGKLVYAGGITASRGHHGDSPGLDAIVDWINSGNTATHQWSVFGCPLKDRAPE